MKSSNNTQKSLVKQFITNNEHNQRINELNDQIMAEKEKFKKNKASLSKIQEENIGKRQQFMSVLQENQDNKVTKNLLLKIKKQGIADTG